jgi:hypothetical protein
VKAVVAIGKMGTFGAAALMSLLAAGAAQAKDPVAEGRYHLRKANGLAGDDRCLAAIREYTLAYQKLHDPVVLFNRAECYRRLGEGPQATADYRVFLEAVPAAANRSEIEAKIAALGAPPSAPAPLPIAGTAPARPPASAIAHPSVRSTVRSTEPSPMRPIATVPPPPAPAIADQPERAAALPLAPAAPRAVTLVETEPSPQADTESHHGKTWIWIALGAAVAGGAVGAYIALRPPATVPPTTALGNYKF